MNVARVLPFLTFVPAVDRQRALDDVQGQEPSTAASMTDGTPNSSPGCWLSASGTRSKPTTPSMSPARARGRRGGALQGRKERLVWGRRSSTCGSAGGGVRGRVPGEASRPVVTRDQRLPQLGPRRGPRDRDPRRVSAASLRRVAAASNLAHARRAVAVPAPATAAALASLARKRRLAERARQEVMSGDRAAPLAARAVGQRNPAPMA
jgi:hypothetical protein